MPAEVSSSFTRPRDPAQFVARAAEITNSADFAQAAALYSIGARATLLVDSAVETYHGVEEISSAWDALYTALQRRAIQVSKRLVAAGVDTVVNDWHAGPGMQGLEVWTFDENGMVCDSVLQGFCDVRASTQTWARLRVALNAPLFSVTMLRQQARTGLLLPRPRKAATRYRLRRPT